MKIAMLLNSFPSLSEKFLINQVTGLMDAGSDLQVFAAHRSSEPVVHALADRYLLVSRAIFANIPHSIRKRLFKIPLLFLRNFIRSPCLTIRALNVGLYTTAARNGKALYFLDVFQGREFDVLHCHFGPNGLIGAFLKDSKKVRRLVVSFHGSDINTYPSRYGANVYQHVWRQADIVTANTVFTAGKLEANGCPRKKIRILPVGLRMEEYPETNNQIRIPGMILTVGRLVEKKGHRYALDAIALLREQFPGVRYVVAGDGPLRSALQTQAKDLGISDIVEFRGACNDMAVAALYQQAQIFVLPSVTATDGDMEGQGLVLQEAQACGLPVVSTLHNGIPDGVLDGISGLLVPESDTIALAKALGSLLSDKARREAMGQAGRNFVAARYDIPLLTNELISIYENAANLT